LWWVCPTRYPKGFEVNPEFLLSSGINHFHSMKPCENEAINQQACSLVLFEKEWCSEPKLLIGASAYVIVWGKEHRVNLKSETGLWCRRVSWAQKPLSLAQSPCRAQTLHWHWVLGNFVTRGRYHAVADIIGCRSVTTCSMWCAAAPQAGRRLKYCEAESPCCLKGWRRVLDLTSLGVILCATSGASSFMALGCDQVSWFLKLLFTDSWFSFQASFKVTSLTNDLLG